MKSKNIALWVISVLVALAVVASGFIKVTSNPQAVANFTRWGHSSGFLYFIGVAEMLGGIGLLVPRTRFWAAVGLMPIMSGAIYTHLTNQEAGNAPLPIAILLLLVITAYARRGEAMRIFAKGGLFTGV